MSHLIPPTLDEAESLLPLEVPRVLDNVRPEIRTEVAYALELAAADTSALSPAPGGTT